MESSPIKSIRYEAFFSGGQKKSYTIDIDIRLENLHIPETYVPENWAALEFQQCSHCPLDSKDTPYCPLARSISFHQLQGIDLPSFEPVDGVIHIEDRTLLIRTTLQRFLKSLYGLVFSLSGCPHTRFLSSMGLFHAPFANESETTLRIVSFHLLHCFTRGDIERQKVLDEICGNFQKLEVVNRCFAERLRGSSRSDAALNAMVLLNFIAEHPASNIDSFFEEIKNLLNKSSPDIHQERNNLAPI